ncbi:MAG: ABC transporter permease, partial [Leifsonia sp.]
MAFGAFSTATPVAAEPAARRRSPIALFLLLPGALYLSLFFLVPFVSLILTSFQAPREFGDIGQYDYAFKWENY